ncbi:hypothetical protein RvY_10182 [Ramazzottius varieornatus]|uniref:Tryptophan 2,3-dioxygenase n=1 Tax=Ramazzottius varieornatus TaxID=947166 RepID=A0A1D1VE13_RAMVA|nr:hypothetical protein RvY_10182 [Ramazzottius varieornatus]
MPPTSTGQQEPATDHQDGAENGRAKQRANEAQEPKEKIEGKVYKDYLKLDSLLNNVDMMSFRHGNPVHDEHLFIITHQTYELWFRQIIWELDSVRAILNVPIVSEEDMLTILQRMNRTASIWKTAVEQFAILETMTPLDFMEFRCYLAPGSGFQSLQFRIIENKMGQKMENRVNANSIIESFRDEDSQRQLRQSLEEPSLCDLLIKWLERTPGLEEKGFNFPARYTEAVNKYLANERENMEMETDPEKRKGLEAEVKKQRDTFASVLDEKSYNEKIRLKERRLSYKAFMGALMVNCYSETPRFHLPQQLLTILMDIDSLVTKWRYNHVILVQRMLGSKTGTGGTSGYMYLRSTVSDRYKVFLDLFNVSSFIIPRDYIPELTIEMQSALHSTRLSGTTLGYRMHRFSEPSLKPLSF